jgi:hypothetical protein
MIGWHQKTNKTAPYSYTCPSYRLYGRNNLTDCRLHKVNQKLIEQFVEQYLRETGEGLEALLATTADDGGQDFIAGLLQEQEGKQWQYIRELTKLWQQMKASGAKAPKGTDGKEQPWAVGSLCAAFRSQMSKKRAGIIEQLAEKEEEMDHLVEQFAGLTSKIAREKANIKMETLEKEIVAIREQLRPLDEQVEGLREELLELERRVNEAREALAGDSNRKKAAAVRGVIRRIVCRFRHEKAGKQDRSILTQVMIEPIDGKDKTFVVNSAPERG